MTWNRTDDVHPQCAQRGHSFVLEACSVNNVLKGQFDVYCDRCRCAGTKADLDEDE